MAARRIIYVQSPIPLGEVTLVPTGLSGRAETETVRAMAAEAAEPELPAAADVLRWMRRPRRALFATEWRRGLG